MQKKMSLTVAGMVLSLRLVFPALGAETIKIGALYNLTGGMSSIDAPALNGAKLQAKLINEKGGLLGKELEVIGVDTKTDQKAFPLSPRVPPIPCCPNGWATICS